MATVGFLFPQFFRLSFQGGRDEPPGRGADAVERSAPVPRTRLETEEVCRSTSIAGRPTADVLKALASEDIEVARQALADIYETYFDTLWHFAYRWTRSRDRAEELVHDVFLRVWHGRTTLKIRSEVIVYLRGAVRNHVYLDARHSGVVSRMETEFQSETTELPAMGQVIHPDASLDQAEVDRVVAKALARISPRDRDVVTMRWIDRMTLDEIASILGVSKSRVRTILTRATDRLIPLLEVLKTK